MVAMDKKHIKQLSVEHLSLVDPETGKVRAILEMGESKSLLDGLPIRAVRLRLLRPDGETALVAEVADDGEPRVSVGHPDRGIAVIVMREGVGVWGADGDVRRLEPPSHRYPPQGEPGPLLRSDLEPHG